MIQNQNPKLNHFHADTQSDAMQTKLLIDFSDLPTATIEEYATSAEQISLVCGLNRRSSRRISKTVCRVLYCFRPPTLMEHSVSLVSNDTGWSLQYRFVTDPIDLTKPQAASGFSNLIRSGESLDRFQLIGEPANGCTIQFSQSLADHFEIPSARELKQWVRVISKGSWEDAFEVITRHYLTGRSKLKQLRDGVSIRREVLNDSQQQANALLSLIAGKTDNAILLLEASGKIEWTNSAACQTFGLDEKKMVGTQARLLFTSPAVRQATDIDQSLQVGYSFLVEYFRQATTDDALWISFQLTPVRDEDDTIVRWIAIGSDVTQRRKTELAMQKAKEAAETANQAKSDFLAMMSHEIRTPMNAIIGMTELALGTELSIEQRDFLTTAHQSSQSLLQILNDILDLSKVEAARLTLEEIQFNLPELVRDTLDTLAVLANTKGISLFANLPDTIPTELIGDPVRIRQVMVNLVGNSIKFTHWGEVEFKIELIQRTEANLTFHFSVRDTGVGIAVENLSRIFEAFYQTDASVSRKFGGTGLGLAITSELIHLMGGKIWAESTLQIGSTFHFLLTLGAPQMGTTRRSTTLEGSSTTHPRLAIQSKMPTVGPTELPTEVKPIDVLVVDDHSSNRKLVCEILRRRGHICRQCSSGREAIEVLQTQTFGLILMDVQMPEQDGLETTRKIRNSEFRHSNLPVIALTAYVTKEDRKRCSESGMNDYLSKPVNSTELIEMVERWGSRCSGSQSPPLGAPGEFSNSLAKGPVSAKQLPVEFAASLARLGGDEGLLHQQMGFFLTEIPPLLKQVMHAIANRDEHSWRLSAHRLKGLARCYDDADAATISTTMEQLSLSQSFDRAEPICAELSARLTSLHQRVKTYVDSIQP